MQPGVTGGGRSTTFFFSSRRRHTRSLHDWSSDVCSSDLEWKTDQITIAFEYQAGTEKLALPAIRRALWMGAQLPVHWTFTRHWSATVRPEMYWDRAEIGRASCRERV